MGGWIFIWDWEVAVFVAGDVEGLPQKVLYDRALVLFEATYKNQGREMPEISFESDRMTLAILRGMKVLADGTVVDAPVSEHNLVMSAIPTRRSLDG